MFCCDLHERCQGIPAEYHQSICFANKFGSRNVFRDQADIDLFSERTHGSFGTGLLVKNGARPGMDSNIKGQP